MKISVQVKPGRKQNLVRQAEGHYVVELRAQPVDGKANTALVCVLAEHFGAKKSQVKIKAGQSGRKKIVEIEIPQSTGSEEKRGPEGT